MEEAAPGDDRRTTKALEGYTAKEIAVLPASILGPIIRQAHIDGGANEMNDEAVKQAIDVVRRGHWVLGLPRTKPTQQQINDLFGA